MNLSAFNIYLQRVEYKCFKSNIFLNNCKTNVLFQHVLYCDTSKFINNSRFSRNMSRTTIEGIFDVEHKRSGYNEFISETFKTAQGNVVDIEEEEFMYRSTAAYTNITKRICGVVLTLQNERGMEKVNFPKELSLYD